MICLKCGVRYAPYPRIDFNFDGEAIVIIREGAEARRSEVYESDEEKLCGACRCGTDGTWADEEVYPTVTVH